jgi:iron complex outermembrane receptor protein
MDDKTEAARLLLKYAPVDRLSVLLSADYAHLRGKGPAGVLSPYLSSDPYTGPSLDGTNALYQQVSRALTGGANPNLLPAVKNDGHVDQTNWGVSATVDYDLGGAKLTVLPAYRHSENSYLHYNPGFPVSAHELSKATSLEARLSSSTSSPFQYIVGGYYFNEDINFSLYANQGLAFNRSQPVLNTRSYAAFTQLSYALSDTFRLTGGLRYTNEHKTQSGRNGGPTPPVPVGFPGPAAQFYAAVCNPYDATNGTCYFQLNGDLKKTKVTYKGGFEYDVAPRSLLYGNVATGFKAGGFFGSLSPNTFKPETLTAYTLGSKNRFLNNSLQLNAEAFYWVYKDKQVTHIGPIKPAGYNLITENAGKAEIYGFETELLWQPTSADTLSANVQYLHSEYKDFTYTQTTITGPPLTTCLVTPVAGTTNLRVNCSGRTLALSPTWTANLSYQHTFRLKTGAFVDAQIGTQIQSKYFTGDEFLPGERQKSASISNATLTYRAPDNAYSFGVFVDNIENDAVKNFSFGNSFVSLPIVNLRPPRTYGARLSFKF